MASRNSVISASCARASSSLRRYVQARCSAKYVAVLYASTRNMGGKISEYSRACLDFGGGGGGGAAWCDGSGCGCGGTGCGRDGGVMGGVCVGACVGGTDEYVRKAMPRSGGARNRSIRDMNCMRKRSQAPTRHHRPLDGPRLSQRTRHPLPPPRAQQTYSTERELALATSGGRGALVGRRAYVCYDILSSTCVHACPAPPRHIGLCHPERRTYSMLRPYT